MTVPERPGGCEAEPADVASLSQLLLLIGHERLTTEDTKIAKNIAAAFAAQGAAILAGDERLLLSS